MRRSPAPPRRRWLRPAALSTGAGAAAVTAVAAIALIHSPSPQSDPLPFSDDFTGNNHWSTDQSTHGDSNTSGGAYRIRADPAWTVWRSGPIPTHRLDEVVVATHADLHAGDSEAAYGVWCHGNPADGAASRYDLWVNSHGQVAIIKQRPGHKPTFLAGPSATEAVHRTDENYVVAQCHNENGHVELRLQVNGVSVASVTDKADPYPPGQVGLVATAGGQGGD